MLEKLKSANSILRKVAPEEAPKICFLFTGQGSQYPGMARKLYEHNFVFKMHFDQCDTLLSRGKTFLKSKNESIPKSKLYLEFSINFF